MKHLPKIIMGVFTISLYLFLGDFDNAEAAILVSQTQSYADLGSTWDFSQDLGTNLSGTATSMTVRLTTSSTIDALAPNSILVDKTNDFQVVTHGCVPSTADPHDLTKGLTITTGGSVPSGFEDVTIDLSCANYSFTAGHDYMFVWSNANSYSVMTFAAHRGSHSDHQDFYTGGGIRYGIPGFNVINCYALAGAFSIVNYVQNCYSWDNDQQNSPATDDLYFILNGTPPAPPLLPIVFIPGIGGSELTTSSDVFLSVNNGHGGTFSHGYTNGEKVWVNENEAASLGEDDYFDVLKLKSDGQTPEASLNLNGYLTPFGYGEVDTFFQGLGYQKGTNYFTYPYDWRFDVKNSSSALDTLVDHAKQVSGQSKVILVAHSMGGLVARNYISDSTRAAKVNQLIEMGVPHLGSVDSIKGLVYGKSLNYTFKFFSVPIIPSSEIKDIFQNLASGFELLPSSKYFNFYDNSNELDLYPFFDDRDVDGDGTTGALNYSQTKNLLLNLGFNTAVFNLSESFHNFLDPIFNQNNGVKIYEIVGTGIPTLGQIKETWWISWPMNLIDKKDEYFTNGDDTVPLYSASLKSQATDISGGAKIYYLTSTRHEDMPKANSEALQIVKKILQTDDTLVENLKTALEGTQVSIDGADIDLYDSSENHTGLKSDGTVEENIPGTFYSGSENTKHVFIKKSAQSVTVKTKASEVTSKTGQTAKPKKVTIRTRVYRDDSIQSTSVYPPVSVTDSSEIDFTIDPQTTTPPTLTSYPDSTSANSGTGGTTIQPASQISNSTVLDQIPPTTTASTSGTLNSAGEYINTAAVTLAANDSGSGILDTSYSLDGGQTLQTYSTSFIVSTIGTTTISVYSTDKVGNQEVPHDISFKIVAPADTAATTTSNSSTSSTTSTSSNNSTTTTVLAAASINSPGSEEVLKTVAEVKELLTPQKRSSNILGAKAFNLTQPEVNTRENKETSLTDVLTALGASLGVLSITFISNLGDLQSLKGIGRVSHLLRFRNPKIK